MTLWEPIVALFVMWRLVVRKLKIVMSTFWVNYIYKLETQFLPQICNFIFGVFKILASSFPPKLMWNLKFGHVVFFQNQFTFLRSFCATKALITTKIEDHNSQKEKKYYAQIKIEILVIKVYHLKEETETDKHNFRDF